MKAEGWMELTLRFGFVVWFVVIAVMMTVFLGVGMYKEIRSLWEPRCPDKCLEGGR